MIVSPLSSICMRCCGVKLDPKHLSKKTKAIIAISTVLDLILMVGLLIGGVLGILHMTSLPSNISWLLVGVGGTLIISTVMNYIAKHIALKASKKKQN